MEPEVTVLIPSFNAGSYLLDALNSVFLQTYQGWEIIIIDDASTDGSLSEVSKYIDNKKVRVIRNDQNLGHSKAMNAGLSLVTTPYVIQLDADDWFYPYTLEVMLAEAKRQPLHVGLISGNINVVHEDEYGQTINSYILKNRSFQEKYDFLICNCSQWPRFYRTSALKSIKGWPTDDPYEGRYMEDK